MQTSVRKVDFLEGEPCEPPPEPEENERRLVASDDRVDDYLTYRIIDRDGNEATINLSTDEFDQSLRRLSDDSGLPPKDERELPGGRELSRVQPGAEEAYPYRRVGQTSGCTGALIGPRHVLTAAHCIYNGGYYRHGAFRMHRNGGTRPGVEIDVVAHIVNDSWIQNSLTRFDYGIKVLARPVDLSQVDRLYIKPDMPVNNTAVQIIGYPGGQYNPRGTGRMWEGEGIAEIPPGRSGRVIRHNIDTVGGLSGAPIFTKIDGRAWIIAVHHGYQDYREERNSACLITSKVAANLLRWQGQYP